MPVRRLLALAACAVLALSGCLRYSTDVTLASDDTVSGSVVVAVKKGTGDSYGMSDREFAEALWEDSPRAGALADAHRSGYDADGYRGVRVSFSAVPLSVFAPTADLWGITRDGEDFVVSGPSQSADALADAAGGEGGVVPPGGDSDATEALADSQILLSVTFPGAVDSANGEVSGKTVTWDLQHGPAQVMARAGAIAPSDPAVAVAYLVCAVLVLGALGYAWAGRRKPRTP